MPVEDKRSPKRYDYPIPQYCKSLRLIISGSPETHAYDLAKLDTDAANPSPDHHFLIFPTDAASEGGLKK